MRGQRELWSNRPFPTPGTAGNQGGMRGGYLGEKETSDSLGDKVTTVSVPSGSPATISGPGSADGIKKGG